MVGHLEDAEVPEAYGIGVQPNALVLGIVICAHTGAVGSGIARAERRINRIKCNLNYTLLVD